MATVIEPFGEHMRSILLIFFILVASSSLFSQVPADTEAKLNSAIDFVMPQSAIDAELDGDIIVRVNVRSDGKAKKASIVSGLMWPCGKSPSKEIDKLSDAISDAVLKATFSPAFKNEKPVDSEIGLTFKIKNPKTASTPITDPETGKPFADMVQGGVLNGKATYLAKPNYSDEARSSRASGNISLWIVIDEQGNVSRVGYASGKTVFLPGVISAVCESKFSPTTLKGRPIKVRGLITYTFSS